jgi:transcription factor SPN1
VRLEKRPHFKLTSTAPLLSTHFRSVSVFRKYGTEIRFPLTAVISTLALIADIKMSDASSPARVALDEPQRSPAEQPSDGLAENGVAEPDPAELSDKDSDLLSEIDEERFDDFEPVEEPSRPVNIDEDAAKTLKASKRKRLGDADGGKTPREGRRQKKRQRDRGDEVMADDDGGETQGRRRVRKPVRSEGEMATQRQRTPEENEEDLTPEERRRRALDRAMDAAIKNPTKRRRKQNEEDLENELDEQIANLKVRMEKACQDDNEARDQGLPAVHKLKLLPEVSAMLNRNTAQSAVLDAESDFFQAVKFFLEPLNDGSLPAYNIQRDIMTALTKLPVDTDLLRSSGIGKIVLFYTRSKRPEPSIKRMAERLIGEWSRPILNRTDDYKKRHIEVRDFDYA